MKRNPFAACAETAAPSVSDARAFWRSLLPPALAGRDPLRRVFPPRRTRAPRRQTRSYRSRLSSQALYSSAPPARIRAGANTRRRTSRRERQWGAHFACDVVSREFRMSVRRRILQDPCGPQSSRLHRGRARTWQILGKQAATLPQRLPNASTELKRSLSLGNAGVESV